MSLYILGACILAAILTMATLCGIAVYRWRR